MHWKQARWAVAASLLLLGIVYSRTGWTVCEEKLATIGNQAVVKVCRPPTLTDLPVVGGLLLMLLLLFPDLAEIGIPGFVSLKRRVEEHDAQLAGLQLRVDQAVEQRQTTVQEASSLANALNVNLIDYTGAVQQFRSKVGPGLAQTIVGEEFSVTAVPAQRAQLESQLVRVSAKLRPLIALGQFEVAVRVHGAAALAALTQQMGDTEQRLLEARQAWKRLAQKQIPAGDGRTRTAAKNQQKELESLITVLEKELLVIRARHQQEVKILEASLSLRRGLERDLEDEGLNPEPLVLEALQKWATDFEQEISIVEAAHQAVVAAKPIEDAKLHAAVQLANGLLEAWGVRKAPLSANSAQSSRVSGVGAPGG
jgi:hypothetical protein